MSGRPRTRVAIAALVAATAAGCGGQTIVDCPATLRVGGVTYHGAAMRVARGAELAQGVVPGCGDNADQNVRVVRLRGVPPALAVARAGGERDRVYLAEGYFPVLPGHPLHAALVRQARGLPKPHDCGAAWSARGVLERMPSGDQIEIRSDGKLVMAVVAQTTRIAGFRRQGEPYLQRGDLVVASGRRCSLGEGPQLVAERIAPFT